MSLSKFESMLKTNNVYFFDSVEFEEIIQHYLDSGKHSLAKKAVKLGLEQHPSSIILKLLKVELLVFEDKLEKAVKWLSEVEAVEPHNEEVFIQKAIILSKRGKHKKAVSILKKGLEYSNEPADIWSIMGMEYLYLDDFEHARRSFEKCVALDFEDYSSLYNVVYCFDMNNQHQEAATFLKEYIDKNPYSEVAWHQLGRQYFVLNNFEEALKAFDYAVVIDESFIGGYLEKAKTLEKLDRYEEAIENYIITTELDDPMAFAYIRIGKCFEKLKDADTAVKYYKKAVHEDPLLEKGWVLLANLYYREKDYQKAVYYIGKALQIDDTKASYWRKYADINLKLDFYEEAIKAFYKCIQLDDFAIDIYIGLADVLQFLGDFNDALKVLIKAKRRYENFAEIEYRLSGLFMILDEEAYSLTHLKNGLAIDFESHSIIKELYPTVFEKENVKKIISEYKV
ncbi:Protein of unknown function containing tetratricopeptide repeats [Tenacibaculum maritimum]|uniref:tetratricopeptide repeat protein n=1 Tax=Tenacibaculum maritimum TaxID=107401 RepID=UPI0012E53284|nr:tetratricopeptide repeat protein [Tenacibaculum maritimum]CAA0194456.1 Protein of unknown function containing tetratricopeptide repeats [Tenacibaculum maritimum]